MAVIELWSRTPTESRAAEVGDFYDDLDEVATCRRERDATVYLRHDLDHLAGALRGIAFMDLPCKLAWENLVQSPIQPYGGWRGFA